jgi:hypothetical protein
MRGNGDSLRLRHGWCGDKRQEQEYEAQHDAMEKHSRRRSQHEILTRTKTR